ncbi:alkaline phosphatase [Dichotomicrobium thermohalophilum]|uniref:Alkaline phosphatase n=1 Tax=Dichotomicrobium thermohalophilum TaxID=933063 RepID=A0A397PIM4_9HYPH|nr:alkaline phosphatase [Dichotomicrobium thermohalophilum]RIA47739.1 alkaline phosphatase [Dichotomicrobium thermohalophilum]
MKGLVLALLIAVIAPLDIVHAQRHGNVIFFHPDGAGLNHWTALRMREVGPDGRLNYDALPAMAIYTGHMKDALTGTSHGGATTHAYGVKVPGDSFGMHGDRPITAASGADQSLMEQARDAGRAVGVVQTGHIAEPGTAVFLASSEDRGNRQDIAAQVIASGAQVIMAGGEKYLLPEGVEGAHGEGQRTDGRNLIQEAETAGYTVVYNAAELAALDLSEVEKLLGVFASGHTFNDQAEQENAREGKGAYVAGAPTVAQMAEAALAVLSRSDDGFFLVVEEEGSDNLANANNARGTLEALRRADEAVGVLHDFVRENPDTLLLMTSDSDAGGMQVLGPDPRYAVAPGDVVPGSGPNGAPLDGKAGTGTPPFMSAPDRRGKRWPFAIAWASYFDVSGGILVRGAGLNAHMVRGVVDNTEIYDIMHATLFGQKPAR